MGSRFAKDPDAALDYQIDWSIWLDSDTISSSSWVAEDGITIDGDTNTATATTIWLSGGTLGVQYLVTNRITTTGGRTDDRSITIVVVEK